MFDREDRFELVSEDVAARVIDGEAIVINFTSGLYYSTEGAGAVAWATLLEGKSLGVITEAVRERYEVSAETAAADVDALLAELATENLIRRAPAPREADAARTTGEVRTLERLPYAAPKLARFTDMAQFFAVDPPLPSLAGPDDPQ